MNSLRSIRIETRATFALAGPMIVSSLIQVAYGVVDTIMLGRYDVQHLAAGALGASLWLLVVLTGLGLAMGITPLVAQLKGAGKDDQIAKQFHQGVWLSMALAVISFIILRNIGQLLVWFDTDTSIIPLSNNYLNVVAWGVALSQLALAGRFVSEGIEYAKPMMIIHLILLPLNIIGNYALIFGHWGAPALGVLGAGIATSIGMGLGFVLMLLNLVYNPKYQAYHLFRNFSWPHLRSIYQILAISIPIAISLMLEQGLFTSVALLMGKLGALPLAAHQVAINYAAMMFMVPLGISMAATVRVGNAVGRQDFTDAKQRGWVAIYMATVFMGLSAICLLLFNRQIALLYTNDAQVIQLAASLLILAAVFQISDGVQVSVAGALRGFKDTRIPMWLNLFGYWIIGFPLAYYLAFELGFKARGLWWGLIVGLTITAACLVLRFKRITHANN